MRGPEGFIRFIMNILFLGDVVAKSGRDAVIHQLETLKHEYGADFAIVNAENAAHGKGITPKIYSNLIRAGADVVTLGNHAFSKKEMIHSIDGCTYLVRPANMEPADVGNTYVIRKCKDKRIAVVNVLGQAFMSNTASDPIRCLEELLKEIRADIVIVDFHGEATGEKMLFTRYFSERLTAVIGTHTHVQTADERIIDGCAFITDAGMCGPYDSILGRDPAEIMRHIIEGKSTTYKPATGPAVISGCLIEVDDETNRAVSIERIQIRPELN